MMKQIQTKKSSFNIIRLIINSYRGHNENSYDLVNRCLSTPAIVRELMNTVNPCMGRSYLENIITSESFIESL